MEEDTKPIKKGKIDYVFEEDGKLYVVFKEDEEEQIYMSEEKIKEKCKRIDIAIKVVKGFLNKYCEPQTELYYSLETLLEELDRLYRKDEKIRENFLKYDWKNSNNDEIYNQLKDLYESIYGVEILNKE